MKNFEVIVSLVAPYKEVRESFKTDMGSELIEIYVHTSELRGREANHVLTTNNQLKSLLTLTQLRLNQLEVYLK
jgi:hypothetical protein